MQRAKQLPGLLICLVLGGTAGCAGGPFDKLAGLNPQIRKEWVEDEQWGPTLHQQLGELEQLRGSVARLSPEEQDRWARELAGILREKRNTVLRVAIVRSLGSLRVPSAVEGLRLATSDADPDVRRAACQAWGERGGDEAVEALAYLVGSDTDLDVRIAATQELAKFSDPRAVRALGLALDDSDPALQYRAMKSLKSATGRDFGGNLVAWREFVQGGNPPAPELPSLVQRVRSWF